MNKRVFGSVFLISAICFALQFLLFAFAQAGEPTAQKFDEFGDIQASDLIARLDNLAIHLQNQPNAKTFLIVYCTRRDLPGLNNRYAHRMKSYLVDSRGILPERVITVDGGIADCLAQELNPKSNGYLIAYKRANRDHAAMSGRMLRTEQNFLIREFGIKPSRIKTIDGGYREWRTMELWIARERGAVPIITSYYSPRRRRR